MAKSPALRPPGEKLEPACGCGGELNGEPQVGKPLNEAAGGGGLVSAVEVVGAEVLVERSVLEHVIDGAQEGSGDGADGL